MPFGKAERQAVRRMPAADVPRRHLSVGGGCCTGLFPEGRLQTGSTAPAGRTCSAPPAGIGRGRHCRRGAFAARRCLAWASLGLAVGSLLAGCAAPVSVRRIDPRTVHRGLSRSVLSSETPSDWTRNVLFRRDLAGRFAAEPAAALAELHRELSAGRGNRRDVFALAELSFLHAERSRKQPYFLAALVYAYAFLFPEEGHLRPDRFDPRLRIAADIYNRSIAEGFTSRATGNVELRAGAYALPFGWLDVEFDPSELRWGRRALADFMPVAELEVRGMRTRYRWPGIGAPLAAGTVPLDAARGFEDYVQPWAKVPVTALVRIDRPREQLAGARLRARLELQAVSHGETVAIGGRRVPIEVEATATLAYMLAESPVWQQEVTGFLRGVGVIDEKARLAALSPYWPGRIPVVLVHGTASSAGRWAEMLNELLNDGRIRGRYQFWLFSYNTGNPILYSAMRLRESLTDLVERLDPAGADPALRQMVVIGHSQGGLLARLATVDSGGALWGTVSRAPPEALEISDATRDLLRRMLFVEPLPFVRRVVFIATPHHGSYFAGNFLSHWIARFITLPMDVVHLGTDLLVRNRKAAAFASLGHLPTAIDNMTPGDGFIRALAAIPLARDVAAHSIIAVKGDGPVTEGGDGIVTYRSAHIDGVESEFVVRAGHSCQGNPHAIEEVRRILLEHRTLE